MLNIGSPKSQIEAVAYSSNGKWAATGGTNSTIKLWNLDTGTLTNIIEGHRGRVTSLAFSPDSEYILSGTASGEIRLGAVHANGHSYEFPSKQGPILSAAFSKKGDLILASDMNAIYMWNVQTRELVFSSSGYFGNTIAKLLSDGRTIIVADQLPQVFVLDSSDGNVRFDFKISLPAVTSFTVSHDLKRLFIWDSMAVSVWDLTNGSHIHNITSLSPSPYEECEYAYTGAVSSHERWLISAGVNGKVVKLETDSGNILQKFEGHTGDVFSLALSPDETLLLTGSYDGTARLWDVTTGKELQRFEG